MYIPQMFRIEDKSEIETFVRNHPFAMLISVNGENLPVATHLPLELEVCEGQYRLTGHLAKANPQWKHFAQNPNVLAVFQGPHAYISSSWYGHENVPTWNYTAVHMYGTVKLVGEERLRELLQAMLRRYETGRESAVLWETLPESLLENLMKGIVGIEIAIETVEAAYKMSQNRKDQDYQAIIQNLMETQDWNSHQVASIMKRLRPSP
jgi:transcriptional regulator